MHYVAGAQAPLGKVAVPSSISQRLKLGNAVLEQPGFFALRFKRKTPTSCR